jgi:hypothetical protein
MIGIWAQQRRQQATPKGWISGSHDLKDFNLVQPVNELRVDEASDLMVSAFGILGRAGKQWMPKLWSPYRESRSLPERWNVGAWS